MHRRLALLAPLLAPLLALAACGAEGSPQPPSGVHVSGTASVGITAGM